MYERVEKQSQLRKLCVEFDVKSTELERIRRRPVLDTCAARAHFRSASLKTLVDTRAWLASELAFNINSTTESWHDA